MVYIESVLLGVSFAAIPGPVFFEVMRRTLTKGFWPGFLVSGGEFFANFTILMLGFLGISQFLSFKPVRPVLFLLGSAVLIWTGSSALRITREHIEKSEKREVSGSNSVLTGFGLAITSPIALASLMSVGSAYAARYSSGLFIFINLLLLASGVVVFLFALAVVVHFARRKILTKYILWLSKAFGLVLIGYGIYFLYQFALAAAA